MNIEFTYTHTQIINTPNEPVEVKGNLLPIDDVFSRLAERGLLPPNKHSLIIRAKSREPQTQNEKVALLYHYARLLVSLQTHFKKGLPWYVKQRGTQSAIQVKMLLAEFKDPILEKFKDEIKKKFEEMPTDIPLESLINRILEPIKEKIAACDTRAAAQTVVDPLALINENVLQLTDGKIQLTLADVPDTPDVIGAATCIYDSIDTLNWDMTEKELDEVLEALKVIACPVQEIILPRLKGLQNYPEVLREIERISPAKLVISHLQLGVLTKESLTTVECLTLIDPQGNVEAIQLFPALKKLVIELDLQINEKEILGLINAVGHRDRGCVELEIKTKDPFLCHKLQKQILNNAVLLVEYE